MAKFHASLSAVVTGTHFAWGLQFTPAVARPGRLTNVQSSSSAAECAARAPLPLRIRLVLARTRTSVDQRAQCLLGQRNIVLLRKHSLLRPPGVLYVDRAAPALLCSCT
ncbi:hypothetical protein EXIGLDRAFT_111469 [Exidia glandulosa HHB12029]|uniref:Uncharacterized protein n=1 Tax=Exidia glandulosa HHB12029 TaxID=1314781 RepID=A0A165NKY1_EXIGL|nr:hypothetical protein EXIGLDRAFT_111469 [Exidia glandulosa HHB12029]